ncbi:MAG: hypothetical protein WAM90_15740 [Rhodanobacter sp.]
MSENLLANLVAAGAALLVVLGGFINWLLRHGSRLTVVEVRQQSMAESTAEERRRNDAQLTGIWSALRNIEDKIDRKVDR